VLRGGNKKGFEETLRNSQNLQDLQVKLIAGESNVDKAKTFLSQRCDFIGFTEKFDLSLHLFGRVCPLQLNLSYQRRVVARNDEVKKSILQDSRLVDMAREFNKLDLELYSFAMTEVFPALCEKAGVNPTAPLPKYEVQSEQGSTRQMVGRLYNKIFRQYYKMHSALWPDPSVTNEFSWFQPTHIARE
jgi:hypothetical protein